MDNKKPFEKVTYLLMSLDPIHVGMGGYRLGRVDNAIIREPATNLPKIPGSSIAGVARAYTAMAIQSKDPSKKKYIGNGKSCAGKGGEDGDLHCGEPDCEVCIPFGFSRKSGSSFQGLAQFSDASILLFPVYSMKGPVWITSSRVLNDFEQAVRGQDNFGFELNLQLEAGNQDMIQTSLVNTDEYLNLGWVYLKNKIDKNPLTGMISCLSTEIFNRIVLVPDKLFSVLVNNNLEVRTSVAINPETGVAEDGALYTYEAIPRTTVMWFDVIYNKPELYRVKMKKQNGSFEDEPITHGKNPGEGWKWTKENVEEGLKLFEVLGVGGMGTRGMGRGSILNFGGDR